MDSEAPSELSKEAAAALAELTAGMSPKAEDEARAWVRLTEGVTKQNRKPWILRMLRRVGLHLGRIAIPVVVMAAVVFVARALIRNELGEAALLDQAKHSLQQEMYRDAYRALSEHAKRFKTKRAAEARTPLVLDALCGMGERDKAAAYLERFLEHVPDSDLAERQDDVCPLGTEHHRRLQEP